jgi:hypothetical protein
MIEQLLNDCAESFGELLESEAERGYLDALRARMTRDELIDRVTSETAHRLRLQVRYPSRLILTLNGGRMKDAEPFRADERLEALLRCRDEQPRRYTRELSEGTRRQVELYTERKERAELKKAA